MIQQADLKHEIITDNADVGVRVFVSEEQAGFKSLHWHNHLEIVLVLSGTVTFRFENQAFELHENEFIVVGSGIIHSTTNEINRSLVLQIPTTLIERYWPNSEALRFTIPNPQNDELTHAYYTIVELLRDMTAVYLQKAPGYLLRFNGQMLNALFFIITNYAHKLPTATIKETSRLKNLLAYIHQAYAQPLTVQSLAAEFHYHPDYLSRLFKQQAGMSLTRYLYQIRLKHIYQDLIDTEFPINEIFQQNGVTNTKLGMKIFKEQYADTPYQIRKKARR
ncbi:MAG: AraC family transcriptional regulator [Lactobacillaceae bacterium]|nr:AraC family transcriptional regulator [Lactobacillaceae bacterium]